MSRLIPVGEPNKPEDHYSIVIPCAPQDFAKFMSGLLGQGQIIEGYVGGNFVVSRSDLESLYHLLLQRVSQQNGGTLVQYTLRIGYDDDSSVQYSSLSDFQSYAEIKPKAAISYHAKWTFLIKFPDRETPERQQVEVTFNSVPKGLQIYTFEKPIPRSRYGFDGFQFRIEHTARTWGVDIESLLSNHLRTTKAVPTSRVRRFLEKWQPATGLLSGIVFFTGGCLTLAFALKRIGTEHVARLTTALSSPGSQENSFKESLKMAVDLVATTTPVLQVYISLVLIIIAITSIALGFGISAAVDNEKRGFLLLTPASDALFDTHQRYENKGWLINFFGTILFSLVTGVAGNYIFSWLANSAQ